MAREIMKERIEFLYLRFSTFVKANKKQKRKKPVSHQTI